MRAVPRKSRAELRTLLPQDQWHSGGMQNPATSDGNPGSGGDTLEVHHNSGLDILYADVHHRSSGHNENLALAQAIRDALQNNKPATHNNFVVTWRMYPKKGALVPAGSCGCGCSCS
jgi:hypothetical protein